MEKSFEKASHERLRSAENSIATAKRSPFKLAEIFASPAAHR